MLFALLVVGEFDLPHGETILSFVTATVLLSMLAHGFSAIPGAAMYSRKLQPHDEAVEHHPSESHRDKFGAVE